jgi:hypothetical protein
LSARLADLQGIIWDMGRDRFLQLVQDLDLDIARFRDNSARYTELPVLSAPGPLRLLTPDLHVHARFPPMGCRSTARGRREMATAVENLENFMGYFYGTAFSGVLKPIRLYLVQGVVKRGHGAKAGTRTPGRRRNAGREGYWRKRRHRRVVEEAACPAVQFRASAVSRNRDVPLPLLNCRTGQRLLHSSADSAGTGRLWASRHPPTPCGHRVIGNPLDGWPSPDRTAPLQA